MLDKSRTGSCKSLTKEQLSAFIAHHGGAVVAMFAPEVHIHACAMSLRRVRCSDAELGGTDQVTHAFSETDRAPLAKSAAMAGIPCLDSCQLAGLIDPDYLQREVSRHEDEAREARAKEQEAEEAMKKKVQLAEQQPQAPATKKKPRIKRTYSAPVEDTEEKKNKEEMEAASHSMSSLPTVKMEEEEEEEVGSTSSGAKRKRDEARESGDGMVAAVKKVVRVAKRRKKLETTSPEDNETIVKKKKKKSVEAEKVEVEGEHGYSSSNGSHGEVPATPLHERRRRFEGKVFFLLGRFMRKQAEMQAFIEENGGEVAKSITRKVTHLLTAQGDDGTLAFKQARQRSLKIITEERLNEFMAAARGVRAQAVMSSTSGEQQGRLLQVPTTPVASSSQRREQAQRVALTPLPSSAPTQPAELLFDASPSWCDTAHMHRTRTR